jgi:hypothetical protein
VLGRSGIDELTKLLEQSGIEIGRNVEQPIAAAATANVSPRTERLWSLNIERLLQARRNADARLRRGAHRASGRKTDWRHRALANRSAESELAARTQGGSKN